MCVCLRVCACIHTKILPLISFGNIKPPFAGNLYAHSRCKAKPSSKCLPLQLCIISSSRIHTHPPNLRRRNCLVIRRVFYALRLNHAHHCRKLEYPNGKRSPPLICSTTQHVGLGVQNPSFLTSYPEEFPQQGCSQTSRPFLLPPCTLHIWKRLHCPRCWGDSHSQLYSWNKIRRQLQAKPASLTLIGYVCGLRIQDCHPSFPQPLSNPPKLYTEVLQPCPATASSHLFSAHQELIRTNLMTARHQIVTLCND